MPFKWHVDMPGPVSWSRPIRKRKHGLLTAVVVWFIVKPLEWIFKALFGVRSRQNFKLEVQAATFSGPAPQPGWYNSAQGPLFFSGSNWFDRDGRPLF